MIPTGTVLVSVLPTLIHDPARTAYRNLTIFRQDYSQPLQNWHPWVGADLRSLLRQSSEHFAGNQCYCCHNAFVSNKVIRTESARLTGKPSLALTRTFRLTLVGTENRDLSLYLVWSTLVTLLVTRIVLSIQYSMITMLPNTA